MELALILGATALILLASISWTKPDVAILKMCQYPTTDTTTFLADYIWICMVTWIIVSRHFLVTGGIGFIVTAIVAFVAMCIWLALSIEEYETISWGPTLSIISAVMCAYVVVDMLYWRGYSLFVVIPIGIAIFGVVAGFRLNYNIRKIRQYKINKESGLIKKKVETFSRPTVITAFIEETPKEIKNKDISFFKDLKTVEDLIKSLYESSGGHNSISEHIKETLDGLAESTVSKAQKFLKIGERIKKLKSLNSPTVKEYRNMRTQLSNQIKDTQDKLADLQLKLDKVEFDKLAGGDFNTLDLEIKALVDGLTSTPNEGTFDDSELDEIAKKYE